MSNDDQERRGDIIVGAARSTCAIVNNERFTKLVLNELKMSGKPLLDYVQSSDKAVLYAPVEVSVGGKWEQGAILGLQDRAVIIWWTGVRQFEHFTSVVSYKSVKRVETCAVEPPTWRLPERVSLHIEADQSVTIRVLRPKGKFNLPFLVETTLLGAVQPNSVQAAGK